MKTEVAIIGGGPSGLLLSQLLNRQGVATVILERASRPHVLSRIRAGLLEDGTVQVLQEAGVADRLARQALPHKGCCLAYEDLMLRIDFHALTGKRMTIYGQSELTADLYRAQDAMGTPIVHEVCDVAIHQVSGPRPYVEYTQGGARHRLDCGFVAGCDGFHGVSRPTIPAGQRREFTRSYPFGWLGVLSETPPAGPELIYANMGQGFALASMRAETLSRYYIQVPRGDTAQQWSDARFWDRLQSSLPPKVARALSTGPSIEKSVAPLRSFVSTPMRWGHLCLAGDSAHIVPPTGAKGLNLAVSDVFYLHQALVEALKTGSNTGLECYDQRALARIWKAMRFSWQMTEMLHCFADEDSFAPPMRRSALLHLLDSETARRDFAENYIGLPL
ncbi:MAG: 4-hydroxybenzoate 3-monooxygenase [Rhodobacteraceae bacterium]|nr:4-hydroxybenzoate 3-monooxygenase [Paracoccaceae bacterium]